VGTQPSLFNRIKQVPPVSNGGISPGQKWWCTILEIEISCRQWEGSTCPQSALNFFLLSFGGGVGGGIFSFFLCSLQVPNGFPSGSQYIPKFPLFSSRVFPIAPGFNPMCFAESSLLHTYVGGPKGEALYLSKESSTFGSTHSFKFFLWWANQIGSLQKGLVSK